MKKIILIIITLLPMMAVAQSHHDTIRLRQVVVTATQHATTRSEAPTAVGVIDGGQMEAVSAVNLGQALNFSTGLRVENTCQNCGTNEVRINGLGQAYSQILIDSRPLNNALAGVYLLDQLPTALIDRIEVLRGGGSALYGSNAIAGVINVITHEPRTNGANVGNTTSLIGGRSWDYSNSFNASGSPCGHCRFRTQPPPRLLRPQWRRILGDRSAQRPHGGLPRIPAHFRLLEA